MEYNNVDFPVIVTGRHIEITDAIRDYSESKIRHLHMEYPKIMEAKVIVDVQKSHRERHFAEIILYCANHITLEASSESEDLYASIDETLSKVARMMRKEKTKMLKKHR